MSHTSCESGRSCLFCSFPQDLCQALEALNSTVTTFSASAQKAVNRESCTQEAVALQQQYEEILHQAKERQKALEDLLAHWQR